MSVTDNPSLSVGRAYTLLHPIGQGGVGTVYEGVEPATGQHVAVKILNEEHAENGDVQERFRVEASVLTSVDHPGSIPVYGSGELANGRPFFVMKKVEGRTLRELLLERGDRINDLTWLRRLADIFERVCETMAYAHRRGIVHRDLKPENILIDDHGAVIVIDWGLAKRSTGSQRSDTPNLTMDGAIMGTPGYMAPEQASGDSAKTGPQGDVFALGAIFYEMLTGVQPFGDEDARAAVLSAIHRQPQDPRRLSFWVRRSPSAICMKALEKDPFRRYPDAGALLGDIQALLLGKPLSVCRRTLLEHGVAAYRRNPLRFALTLAIGLAIVAVTGVYAGQFWIDHRLADKSMAAIEGLDLRIEQLKRGIAARQEQHADTSEAERTILDSQEREDQVRILLRHVEALFQGRSVANLRFIRTDQEAILENHERFYAVIRHSLDYDEPEFAQALVDMALESHESGQARRITPSDVERLQALREEAKTALAKKQEQALGTAPEGS